MQSISAGATSGSQSGKQQKNNHDRWGFRTLILGIVFVVVLIVVSYSHSKSKSPVISDKQTGYGVRRHEAVEQTPTTEMSRGQETKKNFKGVESESEIEPESESPSELTTWTAEKLHEKERNLDPKLWRSKHPEKVEEFDFPDMVHPSEHHEEIFGGFRNLKPDANGFMSRNVHVVGHEGREIHVMYRGRYKDRTHFHNLADWDGKLRKFGCTKEGLVLQYKVDSKNKNKNKKNEKHMHMEKAYADFDDALSSSSVDNVLVTGNQLVRCPKSQEPEEVLHAHEFADEIRASQSRITQSVRRVHSVLKITRDEKGNLLETPHILLKTSHANLLDVFSDLEFSGHTDMVERDSELRRQRYRHNEPNENGILHSMADEYEKMHKEMFYPKVKLDTPFENAMKFKAMKDANSRRLLWGWIKKAISWVVEKVVLPVINFVKEALSSVIDYLKSVVGTIIQPILEFLGRLIPELVNKEGSHSLANGGTLFAINYNAATGKASRILEIDTNGVNAGPYFQSGNTWASILLSGKVVCQNCFARFHNGVFSWKVIIGGSHLGLVELKMKIDLQVSIELDATITITTQVTQSLPSIPIPLLSIPLGVIELGFSLDPEISIGVNWEADGFYYKYTMTGWQEFGVRASIFGGVKSLRDGHITKESVGPLIKNQMKASVYVLPLCGLVFTDVIAVEAGLQPTLSFIIKPVQQPIEQCGLDWSIEFDCPIVLGAWIGLKTPFGMWRLAGFSKSFSVFPTIEITSGCIDNSIRQAISSATSIVFDAADLLTVRTLGAAKTTEYNAEVNAFNGAKQSVMNNYQTISQYATDEETWVVGKGRSCDTACSQDAGSSYEAFYWSSGKRVCSAVSSNNDVNHRTGYNQNGNCYIPRQTSGRYVMTGNNYRCLCVTDRQGYRRVLVPDGGNCGVACETDRRQPVLSGSSGSTHINYICLVRVSYVWRPGFNLGGLPMDPYFQNGCVIQEGTSRVVYKDFSCLCRNPQTPLPPPLQWITQTTGVSCAQTCDDLDQYPVAIDTKNMGSYTENVMACLRQTTSGTHPVLGYTAVRSDDQSYIECQTKYARTGATKCLCTTSIQRYISWHDNNGEGSFADCHYICQQVDKFPIWAVGNSDSQGFLCASQASSSEPYKSGYNSVTDDRCFTKDSTVYDYRCGCSAADMRTFASWT